MNTAERLRQVRSSPVARTRRVSMRPVLAPVLLPLLLLAGCAGEQGVARDWVRSSEAVRADLQVAVLPFENLTAYPNAGQVVAQLLTTELYARGLFRVMEAGELRSRLSARKLNEENMPHTAAAELAAALGVDAVLTGSVSEFGYQHGLKEEPIVGINLRLVSVREGDVVWAASHADAGRGLLHRDSLAATAQRVVMDMVDALQVRRSGS